jgi:uncharacterized RDD family membrane protein YckC
MKKQTIYSKMIPRLFATTLDLFLLSIIATPLTSYISFKLSLLFFKANIAEILMMASKNPQYAQYITASNLFSYIMAVTLINFIIVGAYFILFWRYCSATPGKMIMHLKIVDAVTFEKPSNWQFIKRFFGYMTALFGIWSIPFSNQHQALHDKIATTTVIKS